MNDCEYKVGDKVRIVPSLHMKHLYEGGTHRDYKVMINSHYAIIVRNENRSFALPIKVTVFDENDNELISNWLEYDYIEHYRSNQAINEEV